MPTWSLLLPAHGEYQTLGASFLPGTNGAPYLVQRTWCLGFLRLTFFMLGEIATAAELVKYIWYDNRLDELKPKMTSELKMASISVGLLAKLGAIEDLIAQECRVTASEVMRHWDVALFEIAKTDPRYLAKAPNAQFNAEKFLGACGDMRVAIEAFEDKILEISRVMVVPSRS